jgi:signal transduction histidine kinase
MNVPNIEEIAHDRLSWSIVNSAGDSQPFVVAMKIGQQTERARILKGVHDEISPQLLSAVFLAQILKEKLEGQERDESDVVTRLSEVLVEVIDGLVEVLDPPL